MELLTHTAGSAGAITVGALWAVYVIGDKMWRDRRDRSRNSARDVTEHNLHKQLSDSLTAAIAHRDAERERADKLASQVGELSNQVGRQEVQLEHARKTITELEASVQRLRGTVEELVLENRNKDRSITELVELNRQLLVTLGHHHVNAEPYHPAPDTQ